MTTSTLMNSSAPTRLVLSAPVNVRDLGGIRLADGATVRSGFALRADDLATATESYCDSLIANGLRAVIDLRSAEEVEITGRGPLAVRGAVSYHHLPFMTSFSQAAADADAFDQRTYGAMYLRFIERAAPQIVSALAIMAYAPGTVAFHCAAGADRTGVLAAALLLVLRADPEAVVADYVVTGENIGAVHTRIGPVLRPLLARWGVDANPAAQAATRTDFSPEPMREMLSTLAERHGDPLVPLRAAGLDDALMARLRERAVV